MEQYKRNEFAAGILEALAYVSGVAVTAMIYPPAAKAVGGLAVAYLRYGRGEKWRYRGTIKQTITRFEQRGFVVTETRGEELVVKITQAGKRWLRRYQLERMVVERQKHWDGLWRVVVFDVPEKQRRTRNIVRGWLKRLGFARLQQSVWIIPWPCRQQFEALTSEFKLANQAILLETKTIAKQAALRRQFKIR